MKPHNLKAKRLPSIKVECREKEANEEGAPLYIRITINRSSRYISLKKRVNPKSFDFKERKMKQGDKNKLKINSYLESELKKIEQIILDLYESNKPITFNAIKESYLTGEKVSFIKFVEEAIIKEKQQKLFSERTIIKHELFLKRFKEVFKEININHISVETLNDFLSYLKHVRNNSENQQRHQIQNLKKYLNEAWRKGIIEKNPAWGFEDRSIPSEKEYLNFEELSTLHKIYVTGKIINEPDGLIKHHVLQHFLIAVYTALRYSDMLQLRKSLHIKDDRINIGKMQKTKRPVYIDIRKKLADVLTIKKNSDLLYEVPMYSNAVTNKIILQILEFAGITKHITFHCARHTFAILSLRLGIPMEVISNILGHTDMKTTRLHYAKIVDEVRELHMNKWDLDKTEEQKTWFSIKKEAKTSLAEKENEELRKRISELENLVNNQHYPMQLRIAK